MRIAHRRKDAAAAGAAELDRHLAFQRSEWRAQQIGWAALAVFLTAAISGVFGSGPLSSATASAADGSLVLEYQRFVRTDASERLVFVIASSTGAPVELRLGRPYLDAVRIEQVLPQPVSSRDDENATTFTFAAGTRRVSMDAEPLEPGRHVLTAAAASGVPLRVWQFAYF